MMSRLHASDLTTMGRCMLQWYYRKVEGLIIAPSIAMISGTACHKSVALNLSHKRDNQGEPIALDDAKDAARDAAKAEIEDGVYLVGNEQMEEESLTAGAIDQAVTSAAEHHRSIAPEISPARIEEPFLVDVSGADLQLAGTIDVVESDSNLRDLKTTGKTPSAGTADKSLQLTMYYLGAKVCFKEPKKMTLDYIVNLKSGPKVVQQATTRTSDDIRGLLDRVSVCNDVVKAGNFVPTNPDNWWCGEKYCGYWRDVCPHGRRNKTTR